MGEIVAFRIREKASRHASEPPTGGAQILFFLGVRYMRLDEPPETLAPVAAGAGRARKRKSRARLKA
jgi:hypothetical protein